MAEFIATFQDFDGHDVLVQLSDGEICLAKLNTERLRSHHGIMYGFNQGDKLLLEAGDPPTVVFLITYAASRTNHGHK